MNDYYEDEENELIKLLEKVDRMYDLFALFIGYIVHKDIPIEQLLAIEINRKTRLNIVNHLNEYFRNVSNDLKGNAFEIFKEYIIDFLGEEVTTDKCYCIIKVLDAKLINDFPYKGARKNYIKYTSLNRQFTDKIKIFPIMKNTFISRGNESYKHNKQKKYDLFRKRFECSLSSIDKILNNHKILDEKTIKEYPISIYRCSKSNQLHSIFLKQKKLTFGIAPLTRCATDKLLKTKFEGKTFIIEGIDDVQEKKLEDRYKSIYRKCRGKNIDFLIFPEMLMSDRIFDVLMRERKYIDSPKFVINGSIWKNKINSCIVTDINGESVFKYCKKNPFIYEGYIEQLDSSQNKEYHILEIEGIGRVGVGICKDLLDENIKLFHKAIGTDLLIVPAYSKSMDLKSSAEDLSKEYNCVVVVANACAALESNANAYEENRRIGFITVPAKCATDRSKIIKMYTQGGCYNTCEKECKVKKIVIDFEDIQECEDKISYSIEETSF